MRQCTLSPTPIREDPIYFINPKPLYAYKCTSDSKVLDDSNTSTSNFTMSNVSEDITLRIVPQDLKTKGLVMKNNNDRPSQKLSISKASTPAGKSHETVKDKKSKDTFKDSMSLNIKSSNERLREVLNISLNGSKGNINKSPKVPVKDLHKKLVHSLSAHKNDPNVVMPNDIKNVSLLLMRTSVEHDLEKDCIDETTRNEINETKSDSKCESKSIEASVDSEDKGTMVPITNGQTILKKSPAYEYKVFEGFSCESSE